jgi:hypothetical protein
MPSALWISFENDSLLWEPESRKKGEFTKYYQKAMRFLRALN